MNKLLCILLFSMLILNSVFSQSVEKLTLNDKNYFELQGLNVMVFEDIYPEGHQGGVAIIQHGERVATNGDIRLEPTPGQFQPIPKVGKRNIDKENNQISVNLWYPDTNINRKGFNPVFYPNLTFHYKVKVTGIEEGFKIIVDLDEPLPAEWIGKVGFNLELYPTVLFGKTWIMDSQSGLFPRQANGPVLLDEKMENQAVSMAVGKTLTIVPENDLQRLTIESKAAPLELLDGRIRHTNGWFVVRSAIPAGATKNAIEWIVKPNRVKDWLYKPVVHVSQVGYALNQPKIAVVEIDANDKNIKVSQLLHITSAGITMPAKTLKINNWGKFLRYNYLQLDFSEVTEEGTYIVKYGDVQSNPFIISKTVYDRHVWQPTIEYFLPVQMCHMKVTNAYRVWHGACHLDDALMAFTDTTHFDGYRQGKSTLTKYKSLEHVPGLDCGGWHDAGDDDLRIESQAGTVNLLAMIYEEFKPEFDATTVDQEKRSVEINKPDGKQDILQQIEHGVITILGGYENMGRVYRGIICPTISQYTMVGDVSNQTDNLIYNAEKKYDGTYESRQALADDRMVFTEEFAPHEFSAITGLASAARVLKESNPALATRCLYAAIGLWNMKRTLKNNWEFNAQVEAAVEMYLTTRNAEYSKLLIDSVSRIEKQIDRLGWTIVRALPMISDTAFVSRINKALVSLAANIDKQASETPFGVPYRPHIWGAGWGIQEFGAKQYFLVKYKPQLFKKELVFNALNFVLGCHPGENTASFASGVGSKSATTAYGYNRADWSYIPGGVISGTALIRPDFPELKEFPFLWQQTEYVMGGGETNFVFLVIAVNTIVNKK